MVREGESFAFSFPSEKKIIVSHGPALVTSLPPAGKIGDLQLHVRTKRKRIPNRVSFLWCARGESKLMNQLQNAEDFDRVSGVVVGVCRPLAALGLETRYRKYDHLSPAP